MKQEELNDMQYYCKQQLVSKMKDYVRQHGKKATPKVCNMFGLTDGEGDQILKVLDLTASPIFTMQDKPGNPLRRYGIYCLYLVEDEYGAQWLMHFSDYASMDGHVYFDNCNGGGEKHPRRESLLNESLAFVSQIASIMSTAIK